MKVKIEVMPEVITVYLEGEIDHHNVAPVRESIDRAIETHEPSLLILDFGGVEFMDSSGIGLVMGRYKLMQPKNGEIHIVNAKAQIGKVMKLAGLERLAKIESR